MSPEQIQRLRELQQLGDLFALQPAEVEDALPTLLDIADAYRWRPVEELVFDDWKEKHLLIFAVLHDDGTMDTSDAVKTRGRGYTHFLRLPKLEAPNA